MKHNKKRILNIIDEIAIYLLSAGATDITINLQDREEDYKITIKSNYRKSETEQIDKLISALKSKKQEEVEEYCWELSGESDVGTEIYLVGMMINQVKVKYDNDILELIMYRSKK